MIKVINGKIVDQKDIYIKWDTDLKISDDAARITRYDQRKIDRLGVKPEDTFGVIEEWLDSCDYIVGHNTLGFDVYLIKDYYKFMGKSSEHLYPKFIDTNAIAKGIKMDMPYKAGEDLLEYQYKAYHTIKKGVKTNLTALGKEFEIDVDYNNLHDAVNDLILNIKVWDKLKWQIEI
jgi:hypothetical protein